MNTQVLRVLKISSVAVLLTVMGHAQISPSDDAYVNSAAPTTNYGAASTLNLQSAADTTFIRFDLTAIPAGYTGSSIAKATLKLYVNSATTAGSFNVDYVIGTWAEKTISYSLQPAIGATIAVSVPLTTASKGKYVEIDVTAAVVEWLNGTQANDGIALVANSPLVATFDSKENTAASHAPELDLVFAGIAGVTTASGSGLTGGGASGTLNLSLLTSCAANQVLQWNGTTWACGSTGTGTVTSVGSGLGLKGGPITGSGTLSIDTTTVPQLNSANAFTGNQSVTGSLSSTGTVTGQQIISTITTAPPMVVSSTFQVANLNASLLGGQPASSFPQLSTANNTFAGGITANSFAGSGSGLTNVNAALLGGFPPTAFTSTGANTFSATQTIASGDLSLSGGNVDLPFTTAASVGVVTLGGSPFIQACCPNSTYNTFVGVAAGNFTADASGTNGGFGLNTAVGAYALQTLSSGYDNTAVGHQALFGNTTGSDNTAIGLDSLFSNTTGDENTATGRGALLSNTTGARNTAIGWEALSRNTGSDNTGVGGNALFSNATGYDNTAIGQSSLYSNTTGSFNTASGYQALSSNTTGTDNTASGYQALNKNANGTNNTAIGYQAGSSLLSGGSNILVGSSAGANLSSNESYNIDIGSAGVAGDFSTIRIGDPNFTDHTYIGGIRGNTTNNDGVPVLADSNGELGTVVSSRRYKEDIHNMDNASDGLLRLRPVIFRYKKPYADGSKPIQYGLIAEEVAEVYPDLVVRNKDGQVETVQYYKLDAMLLNEVQKLAKAHAADRAEIDKLRSQVAEHQTQIAALNQNRNDEHLELAQLRAEVERLAGMVRTSNATVVQARAPAPCTR